MVSGQKIYELITDRKLWSINVILVESQYNVAKVTKSAYKVLPVINSMIWLLTGSKLSFEHNETIPRVGYFSFFLLYILIYYKKVLTEKFKTYTGFSWLIDGRVLLFLPANVAKMFYAKIFYAKIFLRQIFLSNIFLRQKPILRQCFYPIFFYAKRRYFFLAFKPLLLIW